MLLLRGAFLLVLSIDNNPKTLRLLATVALSRAESKFLERMKTIW